MLPCDFCRYYAYNTCRYYAYNTCRYYASNTCRKCDWKDALYADIVGMPHRWLARTEAEKIAAEIEKDLEEKL